MAPIGGCLMAKFVDRDQWQLFISPVDMRERVPRDELAHFIVEAVDRVPMSGFVVNEGGTGGQLGITRG